MVYFIERGEQHAGIEFAASADAFRLIAHTFNALIGTEARLTRQLDTSARVTANALLFDVKANADVPAQRLADALGAHFTGL